MKKIICFYLSFSILICAFPSFIYATQAEIPISELFKKHVDSIVLIGVVTKRNKVSRVGSGFFVSEDGYIVTNYHIVEKAINIFVKLKSNHAYSSVRVVGFDAAKDIAILKIDDNGFKPVTLGNSNHLEIGQKVVTIGNPLGLENTVTDGLISSIRQGEGTKLLQISVPLSNGNSGGPLFDLKGEVVGITTAAYAKGQNLNFAVPINYIKPLLRKTNYTPFVAKIDKPNARGRLEKSSALTSLAFDSKGNLQFYVIKPKDTLFSLAKRFNTTVDQLKQLNNLKSSAIYKGQKIMVPGD